MDDTRKLRIMHMVPDSSHKAGVTRSGDEAKCTDFHAEDPLTNQREFAREESELRRDIMLLEAFRKLMERVTVLEQHLGALGAIHCDTCMGTGRHEDKTCWACKGTGHDTIMTKIAIAANEDLS